MVEPVQEVKKREAKAGEKNETRIWTTFLGKFSDLCYKVGHQVEGVKKIECCVTIDTNSEDDETRAQTFEMLHQNYKSFIPDLKRFEVQCRLHDIHLKQAGIYKNRTKDGPLRMQLILLPHTIEGATFLRHTARQIGHEWKKAVSEILRDMFREDCVPIVSDKRVGVQQLQETVWSIDACVNAGENTVAHESFSSTQGGSFKSIVITKELESDMEATAMQTLIKAIALEIAMKIYKPQFQRGSDIVPTEAQVVYKGKPVGGPLVFGKPFLSQPLTGLGSADFQQKNDLNYCVMFGDYTKLVSNMEQEIHNVLSVCPGIDNVDAFIEQLDREFILEAVGKAREQGMKNHVTNSMSQYKVGLGPHVCLAIDKKLSGQRVAFDQKSTFDWNPFLVSEIYGVNFLLVTSTMGEIGTRNLLQCSDRAVNMLLYGAKNTGKTSFLDMARNYMSGEKASPTFDGFQCPGIGGASCLTSEEYDPVHRGMDIRKINKIKAALDITATKSINVKYINIKEGLRNVPWFISANEDIADMECRLDDALIPHVEAVNDRLLKLFLEDNGTLLAYTKMTTPGSQELCRLLSKDIKSPGEAQEQMFNYMLAFTPFKTKAKFAYLWTEKMIRYSVVRLSEILSNPFMFRMLEKEEVMLRLLTCMISKKSEHDAMVQFLHQQEIPQLIYDVIEALNKNDFESEAVQNQLHEIKTKMPRGEQEMQVKRARMHAFVMNNFRETRIPIKQVILHMDKMYAFRFEDGRYLIGDDELRAQLQVHTTEMALDIDQASSAAQE